MLFTEPQKTKRELTGSQAAQLLRNGRLGAVLIGRASSQVAGHRSAASDQAQSLRRAIRALETAEPRADGAAA